MDAKALNKSLELSQEQYDKYVAWVKSHRGTCPHTSNYRSYYQSRVCL